MLFWQICLAFISISKYFKGLPFSLIKAIVSGLYNIVLKQKVPTVKLTAV